MTSVITLTDVRAALKNEEFLLEYLPTHDLDTGQCVGAEALIRWRRVNDVLQPLQFIPIVENTPISGLITYWVIDTVTRELGQWLHSHPDAHVAINVPPEILGRGGIEYAGNKSGLSDLASQVILEVTERGVPDLLGIQAINDSWGTGVRLALDDFSNIAGANLALLARCNFHIIKVDMSLVSQITDETPMPDWLPALSAIVESSLLTVIAEGVETEQQLKQLQASGIQQAQGFHFSKPLRSSAFMEYYAESNGNDRISS